MNSMFRRKLLSGAAGTAGAVGLSGLAHGDNSQSPHDHDDHDVHEEDGDPFYLTLQGTATPTLASTEGDMQALVSTFSGNMTGDLRGGYHGQQVALVFREPTEDDHDDHEHHDEFATDTAKVTGRATLSSPDRAVGSVSTYEIVSEGWITECCGESEFSYEATFQSVDATGRFEGTKVQGTITSQTDLGWPQQLQVEGVQIEE